MISGTPSNGTAPLVVTFSATGSADADGDTLSYDWTFGDGGIATGATTNHTYTTANTFTATLSVSDGHGHTTNATKVVTVTASGGGGPMVGSGSGLLGTYFDNPDFTGTSVQRTDAVIDFSWGTGAPISGIAADTFSVRWTGKVQAQFSETYTFTTTTDDGVRLWVNGVKLIDDWTSHAPTTTSGTIALTAGQQYDLQMDYYDDTQGATARLTWSSPSTPQAVIPASQTYPAAAPVAPPAGVSSAPAPQNESSGKCGLGGGVAALLFALLVTLRLSLRPRRRSV